MGRPRFIVRLLSGLMASLWLGAAAAPGTAGADGVVILTSTLPELVPGTILAEDQNLSLRPDTSAVLLFRSGEMLRLTGPFDGNPAVMIRASGAEGSIASLVALLRAQGVSASVMGATRALPAYSRRPRNDDDVIVAVERSGIYCVEPSDTVWLSRQAVSDTPVRLRRGRGVRELAWPVGAHRIEWPSDLPIEDGDIFEVLDKAGAPTASMNFRRLGAAPSTSAWIAERILVGCRQQAEPALRELAGAIGDVTRR
jgi:hypothetical protein